MESLLISKYMSRVAAVGAAGALGAVALVGIAPTADAASATPLKTTYGCTILGTPYDFPVTIKMDVPATGKAKKPISAKPFKMVVTIPEEQADLLRDVLMASEVSGTAYDAKYSVGSTKVNLGTLKIAKTAVPDSGPINLPVSAPKGTSFTIKKKGTYVVNAPKSFTFAPKNQDNQDLIPGGPVTCAASGPTKTGTIKIK